MKYPSAAAAGLLAAALAGLAIAKAPDIDPARIDSAVSKILNAADQHPNQTAKPDGQAIRQDVTRRLQTLEVLKNEAIKAGLDKDRDVQLRLQNAQAAFYAAEYGRYLERSVQVDEDQLRRAYDVQTRLVKLQQVGFASIEEVRAAQELLLKGLSFDELAKRYPNPQQAEFDRLIPPSSLARPIADIVNGMSRGDVTHEPVEVGGRYFLFKLSAVERDPEAAPFELVRSQVEQAFREQKAQEQIDRVLKQNGLEP